MQCEVYKWMLNSGYEQAAVQITSFQLHVAKLLWRRSAPSLFEYSRDGICLPFYVFKPENFKKKIKAIVIEQCEILLGYVMNNYIIYITWWFDKIYVYIFIESYM